MRAQVRLAARALLVTPEREILLMQVELAPDRRVWITPGGGLHDGETPSQAAARETFEETGRSIEAVVPVWTRTHTFELEQQWIRQCETYFLVPTPRFEPRPRALEGLEQRFFRGFRWWRVDEIHSSGEQFAPTRLGHRLSELLACGPSESPIDVGV